MNKKVTSIVGYCSIIGWLVAYFAGDKEGAKFHLNQGLTLGIVEAACVVLNIIIGLIAHSLGYGVIFIGILLTIIRISIALLEIACTVFSVIGIINAATDQSRELPIIGKIQILK